MTVQCFQDSLTITLRYTHGGLPDRFRCVWVRKKVFWHRQLLSARFKFPATRATSENRLIVADDLPATLRFPGSSVDFVQKQSSVERKGDLGINKVCLRANGHEDSLFEFQFCLRKANSAQILSKCGRRVILGETGESWNIFRIFMHISIINMPIQTIFVFM